MHNVEQVEKSLSGSSTEDNSDDSDNDSDEDTDKLKKQTAGNLNVTQQGPGESKESSDESGDLARPGLRGFPSLTTRTAVPSGNFPGGSPLICVLDGFVYSLRICSRPSPLI